MLFHRVAVAALARRVGPTCRLATYRPPLWLSTLSIPPPPTSNHPHTPVPGAKGTIIYTETDEAPALATYSLYPAVAKVSFWVVLELQFFFCQSEDFHPKLCVFIVLQISAASEIDVVPCDISVAGRVLALFPEKLKDDQRVPDNLAYLGELAKTPEANIIKLPNISAPLNQLEECIAELRAKGYDVPLYPREPKNDAEKEIKKKYASVMGSAVNPVLREGNSDRRVAPPVKAYAQKNPHRMGLWSRASRTHVATMKSGDFYGSEQSATMKEATDVIIEFTPKGGAPKVLKESTPLEAGEVIDASFMSVRQLQDFYEEEIDDAKEAEILFSLHLKATMMKFSDPIMFGHCIRVYFKEAFEKHGETLQEIGANPNNGLASIFEIVKTKLDDEVAKQIIDDFNACYEERAWLAMVDSSKGITNLHAPNDIIIDASMPVVIRDSGKMWNKLDEMEDCKCVIPDRCYATMYQECINYVKTHGQVCL
jgi:isocitrate dehydrogenase